MNVKQNETLNLTQLCERLGISRPTFAKNRKEIEYDLAGRVKYSVEYKGRALLYHFYEDLNDFYYKKKSFKRDKVYEDAILETLSEQPINTAKNVSRILMSDWPEMKEFNYTDKTNYEYVRTRIVKWFGKNENDLPTFEDADDMNERKGRVVKRIWCKFNSDDNTYTEIPEDEINDYYNFFGEAQKEKIKEQLELCGDYESGIIDEEDFKETLKYINTNTYATAKKLFKAKYGYYPIRAGVYEVYE